LKVQNYFPNKQTKNKKNPKNLNLLEFFRSSRDELFLEHDSLLRKSTCE
jgi:hypothetical protein